MTRLVWGVVGSVALILSCGDSGQTGSPDCAPRPLSCVCAALAEKHLVKATLLELNDGTGTLEIEQVLNPNQYLDERAVQRLIIGPLTPGIACGTAQNDLPRVGDAVFAAFSSYGDEDPITTGALVQAWTDTIELGDQTSITRSQAIELGDPERCDALYPAPPAPPCNDTSTTCALSTRHGSLGASSWWFAPLLLALAALRLRRRKSRRP